MAKYSAVTLAVLIGLACGERSAEPPLRALHLAEVSSVDDLFLPDPEPLFPDNRARDLAIAARVVAAEEVEIEGVVHASGPVAIGKPHSDAVELVVDLQPWRTVGAALDERRLDLRRVVDPPTYDHLRETFPPYAVVKVRAKIDPQALADPASERLVAALSEVVDARHTSDELERRSAQLQRSVEISDPFFGTLTLNRDFEQLAGSRVVRGAEYDLLIDCSGPETADLVAARRVVEGLEAQLDDIVRRMATDLLVDHETAWDSDEKLTVETIAARVSLGLVAVKTSGTIEAYFDDGGLFMGHSVLVRIGSDGSITTLGLQG